MTFAIAVVEFIFLTGYVIPGWGVFLILGDHGGIIGSGSWKLYPCYIIPVSSKPKHEEFAGISAGGCRKLKFFGDIFGCPTGYISGFLSSIMQYISLNVREL